MIQKAHLENFLRINGIPPTADDEEIRTALISARWKDDDVEVALMVLKGHTSEEDFKIVSARRLLHTDSRIAPEQLSELLGIQIKNHDGHVTEYYSKYVTETEESHTVLVVVSALVIAAITILAGMYLFQVGPFHVPETLLS